MLQDSRKKTLLIFNQVYPPDPTSVGQHVADAAAEMSRRGYRVLVYTSRRDFNNPERAYPWRETRDGVDVRRLPFSSFGKSSIRSRLLGAILFVTQCAICGLFARSLAGILVSTSPPIAPAPALFVSKLRRAPLVFWAMDVNPDQAIVLGAIRADSLSARLMERLLRTTLTHATRVIALDRFMAERLKMKVPLGDRLEIIPPWPHDDHLEPIPHEENPFRKEHGLDGKLVLMYSGNVGVNAPLDTVLPAALELRDRADVVFVFVGGGTAWGRLEAFKEEHQLENLMLLPYQPLEKLKYSLSAADVHIVSLAAELVGICHPCKAYGAMTVGRPILYIGPSPSHISDLLNAQGSSDARGWKLDPSELVDLLGSLGHITKLKSEEILRAGERGRLHVRQVFDGTTLQTHFCDLLESAATTGQCSLRQSGAAHTDDLLEPPEA